MLRKNIFVLKILNNILGMMVMDNSLFSLVPQVT